MVCWLGWEARMDSYAGKVVGILLFAPLDWGVVQGVGTHYYLDMVSKLMESPDVGALVRTPYCRVTIAP